MKPATTGARLRTIAHRVTDCSSGVQTKFSRVFESGADYYQP